MLNNIGLPGLILVALILFIAGMSIYAAFNVSSQDNRFRYGGFWLRALASVIDGIIVAIPSFIIGFLVGFVILNMAQPSEQQDIDAAGAAGQLCGILISWLYFAYLESSPSQATFGKRMVGLKVTDLSGNRISFGRASGRHFSKFLSMFIIFIGYFMAGWTKQKQGLHDKMASCLVVRSSGIMDANIHVSHLANIENVDSFDAEALRRFKRGELSEEAFFEIVKKKG